MDIGKLWGSLIFGFFIGFFFFVAGQIIYVFLSLANLAVPFVVDFVFFVIVAFLSYWRIKSPLFGFVFGIVIPLVPEIFRLVSYGFLPFGYLGLFGYPEIGGLVFASMVIRFVGFPVSGFFGSHIWRIRKENY